MSKKAAWRRTKPARADGTVYAQLVWTARGERHFETLGWVTPRAADEAAERKSAELLLGLEPSQSASSPARGVPTIEALVTEYVTDLEARNVGGDGYRTNVVNRAAYLVRHLGAVRVDRLTTRDLEQYVSTRRTELGSRSGKRAPKRITVQDELRMLRRMIDTTGRWGRHDARFPGMPSFRGWPKDAKPPRRLTPSEHHRLVEVAALDRPGLARLIAFMGWCPRRPLAVFDMRREDCARALDASYDGRDLVYFRRDKGGEARGWGPLLPEARAILIEHLRDSIGPSDEVVWHPAISTAYTAKALGWNLRYLCKKAGVPLVTPYDLRKLAAVRAYQACRGNLRATCLFTGHREGMTLYRHYLFEDEDVVMAAVRGTSTSSGAE